MSQPSCVIGDVKVLFATPRKLPRAADLPGRVVVVDIAFAAGSGSSGFERTTQRLIEQLGERLVAWVDHHDSRHHERFREDPRFVLTTKAICGACPELISPALVARVPWPNTIVCHTDFDGLTSAAKWLRRGIEPYPGCDADARAIDTCLGRPGPTGTRIDRALRAGGRDATLLGAVLRQLVAGGAEQVLWEVIDRAARAYAAIEEGSRMLAEGYRDLGGGVVLVDVGREPPAYDKTLLLLLGQDRAPVAAVLDGDSVTFAARYDSGVDFLERFDLSGGMPTRVSIPRRRLPEALAALGVPSTPRVLEP